MAAPSISDSLDAFVRKAKAAGVQDDALTALLKQNGWSDKRILRSLSAYYTDALGVAPPVRSARGESARDAFMYALNFITLCLWTTAVGNLLYVLIARAFPGAGEYVDTGISGIAWQLATTIVALPIFIYFNRAIAREMGRRPDVAESPVRLWFTYGALVLAAVIVIGDAVWILQALLLGQLTVRFLLDSLVLLILGGGVFVYYFSDLHQRADR